MKELRRGDCDMETTPAEDLSRIAIVLRGIESSSSRPLKESLTHTACILAMRLLSTPAVQKSDVVAAYSQLFKTDPKGASASHQFLRNISSEKQLVKLTFREYNRR